MSFELVGVKLVAEDGGFFGTMSKADKAVSDFGSTNDKTFKQMPGLADIAVGALHKVGAIAVEAFAAAGQAAVGFFTDSIGAAGDFEAGMNNFTAVAGGALDDAGLKTKDFRDLFLTLGKELPVSTKEVQDAATEMIKGGIDPATIAAGGLKQNIQFAAAAMDGDLKGAAEVSAKILGGWADQGATAAEKSDLLTKATDLLTKAANASTVDVKDLALGLYNVQGTAKTTGLSLDETTTALAELAPRFASSSEAGTSFKNFLVRLQPSTKPATKAMKDLGLFSEETGSKFFDAQGKFIGVAKASDLLKTATSGLTDAQKVQALQTIFGNDAMNTASAFAENGAKGFDDMAASMAKQSGVAATAETKQAGFNTALDNFHGSVEALQITIGSVFLPILTKLFDDYLAPGINTLTDIAGALSGDNDAFGRLSPAIQGVVEWISQLFSGTGGLSDIWTNTLMPAIQSAGAYFEENIVPILDNLANIVFPLLGSALQVLSGLWSDVLYPALQTAWDIFNALILPILKDVTAWLAENLPPAIQGVADFLTNTLFPAIHDAWSFIDANFIPILKDVVQWLQDNIPPAIQTAADFWNNTLWPALNKVWKFINENVIPIFNSIINTIFPQVNEKANAVAVLWNETLWPAFKKIWDIIEKHIVPLFEAIANVLSAVVKKAIEEFIEKLSLAWEGLKKVSDFVNEHVLPDWTNVQKGLEIVSDFIKKTIGPAISTFTDDVLKDWADWFGRVASGIDTVVGWLNDLADAINSLPEPPSWVVGHSPPPMAKWMLAIADATGTTADAFGNIAHAIKRGLDDTVSVLDTSLGSMGDLLTKGELPDQARSLGQFIMEGIGSGIANAADAAVDQINAAARRMNDAMSNAVSLGAPGSGAAFWNNLSVGGGGNTMNMPISPNALYAAANNMTTNNNQRNVNLNYHTTYAPPASQSLALASALAG